jgi:dTDP-4-dehydrorhamnose reductase
MRGSPGGGLVAARDPLQVWGGLECSLVRIGDDWRDQFRETGHFERGDDLDRVAELGIRVLRYPVLWERVAPHRPDLRDWSWHDERLARLRRLGLTPIVGLLHHGSGPRYTGLLHPEFPEQLATHADAVAARYPWVEDWTPVNEPLTTARFSGLYGHWYPHHRDGASFFRMVVNQCRGTLRAMRAIRRRIPNARLVQTEDLGRTFASPRLRYQADFENERRWLSLDLLCGRVGRSHPLWRFLRDAGVTEAELGEFTGGEGTPDFIGINHYLTSERYLDPDVDRYPPEFAGGNGRESYADVEAVRIAPAPGPIGPEARLREAWERYRLPMLVTEAHHGCAEEIECVRWLAEIWAAAQALRAQGADLRAVTIWSMFGAMDWRSLLRERAGAYESGVFDIRTSPPRPTGLALAAGALLATGRIADPEAHSPGWWRRPERVYPQPRVRQVA